MTVGLIVSIIGDVSKLDGALDEGGRKVSAFGKEIDVGGAAKMLAFAAAGAIAVNTLKGWADAAAQDTLEAEQMAKAIENAGAAVGDWEAQLAGAIAAGQELAFTDTQIQDSLKPLVAVTGDLGQATDLLAIAQDVARLKGIDLATAAEAVAKAEGGQATALAKLVGINAKGLTATEVLTEAQRRAAGQAEVYGKSTTGQAEAMGIKFDELTEKIGYALLPVLDALIPVILELLDAFMPLLEAILPPLTTMFRIFGTVLSSIVRIIVSLVGFVQQLIRWLSDAIRTIGDFLGSLGPLQAAGDFLGGIFGGPGLGPFPGGAGVGGSLTDARTFTVYASSADPDAVVRALRRYAALNGGRAALDRAIGD